MLMKKLPLRLTTKPKHRVKSLTKLFSVSEPALSEAEGCLRGET